MHARAVNELDSRLYDDEAPLTVSALPDSANPFVWTGIVETQASFRVYRMAALDFGSGADARLFLSRR